MRLTAQISRAGDLVDGVPERVGVVGVEVGAVRARRASKTSRATQVGACTPLVIELIGTSARVEAGPQAVEHARG